MSEFYPKAQGLYDPAFEHDSCGVGFVCDIKGRKSHDIVRSGIEVLKRLEHRGAVGADPKTGDGAGILIQIPHKFFAKVASQNKIDLPAAGEYGTGLIFLPPDKNDREFCLNLFAKIIEAENQTLLGWRELKVDDTVIGETARKTMPVMAQVFIGRKNIADESAFERKLYLIRKQVENAARASDIKQRSFFYITNLSCRTFAYKGLLMTEQVEKFFTELNDAAIESAICLVHSRYSTNTFPTWDLAQPFRYLAHNGEINTLRGNINWMKAREGLLKSDLFGADIEKVKPVIVSGGSDSAMIDNVFELLVLAGRPIEHVMMMLIPSAWEENKLMNENLRDFYRYHACLLEPWDGPAAMAFTDGVNVGALLDRNGLRPARYLVTNRDMVVMSSEVGVLNIAPEEIVTSGRLEPGKMFFINTKEGRIIHDEELKNTMAGSKPYGQWLKKNMASLEHLSDHQPKARKDIFITMKAFGFSREDLNLILKPMLETAYEPTGSMGNDIPHALLSQKPKLMYEYFKQLFAQVTNPPIDSIREQVVMSLNTYAGAEKNILEEGEAHCKKVFIKHPVLSNTEFKNLIHGHKIKIISITFDASRESDFTAAIERICAETEAAIKDGCSFIILSDRKVDEKSAALPALLAVGAVHHHLVKNVMRTRASIILESAEPREVHHFGLLFGYGADCINPYFVYDIIEHLITSGEVELDYHAAQKNYLKAIEQGILKILSKMGISTLQSYRGAQIFEAIGIHSEVIDRCFSGTPSRIGGVTFDVLAKETLLRHNEAYHDGDDYAALPVGGVYQWRKEGEFHLWNPESIAALQDAVRKNDYNRYKEFAALIDDQSKNPTTLRSLFKFKNTTAVPINEVEPLEKIFKRFATGAMSFGSISRGAHETLAIAMNRLGGKSNTGEGGEDPERFKPLPNGDSKRSSIKQVASGRFGVTINYLTNADEIQIKIAQGAKPGEGGQLPGHKVSATIAKTRYTTAGVTLISPPPHHDIYSIEDLAQLIFDLKNSNPRARISVKLVSEIGVGTVAAGVAKGKADMILISGFDGGTGASPRSSIRHAGLPWELGLSETHQTLVLNDLRSRVRLQADGQMRTGRDVAIAAILGAEEYGFCTAALIVMGCVMLRHCHLNNCSVGVATQDDILQERFSGKVEHVINYFNFVGNHLREVMASLGVRTIDELIGRTDLLETNSAIVPWKAKNIDLSKIFYQPKVADRKSIYCTRTQDHKVNDVLDRKLIDEVITAIQKDKNIEISKTIANTDRTTGAMLSGEVCRLFGDNRLCEDTVKVKFSGTAGQSFGAFLAKGITFELSGLANDYVGKGISGGKIIIYPGKGAQYVPEENIIIGNTTFYGAIAGQAYIRGLAGERFCIRNSGLYGVVEGVGDHGCEYMTGGRIVILGKTGRNFGAGMSGGVAYVYDVDGKFKERCNMAMVELGVLEEEDKEIVHSLISNHYKYTQSTAAKKFLDDFTAETKNFVRVMPLEYKRIMEEKKNEQKLKTTVVSDG